MAADRYTEVSSQSLGGRLGGSLVGMLIGLILIVVAIGLLAWNEGRAVKRARALQEGAGQVVSVSADAVDPANQGRLIHVSARAETDEQLTDPEFGVTARALKLRRSVEMYQWREESRSETREKLGGGTETVTTYSYDKGWARHPIDSSSFRHPQGHGNPDRMPYQQWSQIADDAHLGGFRLSRSLLAQLDTFEPVPLASEPNPTRAELQLPPDAQLDGHQIYLGDDPGAPKIGDTRIRFAAVYPQPISVIAVQRGNRFAPYQASNGDTIELLETGVLSAQEMFEAAQQRNRLLTWGLRLGGFVLMSVGIGLLFGTLRVLASIVPALGRLVGGTIGLVSGLLAAMISLVTIAIAWLFYRPLVGAGLLVAAAALLIGLKRVGSKAAQSQSAGPGMQRTSGPPPPPPPPPPG